MQYILIDNFNDTINIVCKDDGSGNTLIIDSLKEAEELLSEYCQDGQIIPLGIDLIYLIKELNISNKDNLSKVHIGDLIANVLDEDLSFP